MSENDIAAKLMKVVKSVTTIEQTKSAAKYYWLWRKRYSPDQLERNPGVAAVDGMAGHYLLGFRNALELRHKQSKTFKTFSQ